MPVSATRFAALAALVSAALLPPAAAAAGASAASAALASAPAEGSAATTTYSDAAALGKLMFYDQSLSASGKMSCASCHSPAHAYGPPDGLAAQLGGADMHSQGTRAVPSLRYVLNRTPVWTHAQAASLSERIEDTDNAPVGGFGWDGRFNYLRDQASFPLFNPNEMANKDPAAVAQKLEHAPYAARFKEVFGQNIFVDPHKAFTQAMYAIERFELEDPSFHPYTSKFDYYLDGKVQLTASELRGKKLFDDPDKGNCASCHIDQSGVNGAHLLFTDYNFEALGVPRNPELKVNADPHYFDMGLCGPLRTDQSSDKANCGLFKTPSLRNTATRRVFFHNGRFHSLKESLRFYVQRDTNPEKWYPADRHGKVDKFDDLPPDVRINVDTVDAPLTSKRGERPVWSERDIDDVAAFLTTLNDGYPYKPKPGK
ncbi:cytochrome-c peroxidase [Paraburkholderia phenazinium]|uniref:Cytochrome c peroxidase n=1 Tax=Paraburkholderia phenazinium TaxID=60549 RepID=A0A1G8LUG6_9BURK|nr:cytochrome c peroxidase [Paraburkholderia phenazinium]SDI59339.1 cytochrome c peroxidase [Paraburkholderia phenazinium]